MDIGDERGICFFILHLSATNTEKFKAHVLTTNFSDQNKEVGMLICFFILHFSFWKVSYVPNISHPLFSHKSVPFPVFPPRVL